MRIETKNMPPYIDSTIIRLSALLLVVLHAVSTPVAAAEPEAIAAPPPRSSGEGPYSKLILRGVTLVNGAGAPPRDWAAFVLIGLADAPVRAVVGTGPRAVPWAWGLAVLGFGIVSIVASRRLR